MTEEEALAELTLILDAASVPVLDEDDLDSILVYARRPDADDLTYEDSGWTPTWNLNSAAAEGWRRKASKAAGNFNFAEDAQRFDRAQVYAHCVQQAELYARREMGSIDLGTATT